MRKEWGEKIKRTQCYFLYMGSGLDMIHRGGRQGLISRMQVNKRHLAIRIGVPDWSPTSRGSSQVALVVKNPPANAGDVRDTGLIPGLGNSPWRRKRQPTPVFLPEESHGQRSLVGYSSWGHKEA